MFLLALSMVLAQDNTRVSVLDISAADAIYEDISRGLADRVSTELLKLGFLAHRADESELPIENCRIGPCLAKIAQSQQCDVLVLLDAVEGEKGNVEVALSAMRGANGLPLAAGKWTTTAEGKSDKKLKKFFSDLQKALSRRTQPKR